MSIAKKMLEASAGWAASQGAAKAEGVDFDGTNDYLSKSADLTGNADGKTFTFSAWVYMPVLGTYYIFEGRTSGLQRIAIYVTSGQLRVLAWNGTGGAVLNSQSTAGLLSANTWNHILVSIDLTNTSNRHYAINDVVDTGVTWSTYTNDAIDFTNNPFYIGTATAGINILKGRLAHVYLDYTYRDLSNSANRRLFIDADLKPAADQASLSPILYLPMTDADTAHVNEGTGGDFTANGTFATSQRGPNQYNCRASTFDGSSLDVLSNATVPVLSDTKTATASFVVKTTPITTLGSILKVSAGSSSNAARFEIRPTNTTTLRVLGANAAGSTILQVDIPVIENQNTHIVISVDLTNTANRYVIVNGIDITSSLTWTTYIDDLFGYSACTDEYIGWIGKAPYFIGVIGELYFDSSYTDLPTDNPFWDANTSLPKPVRQMLEDTGNTPLVAMPFEASNAGLNLGTTGDFTLAVGPLDGARSISEYWAKSANQLGTGTNINYLWKPTLSQAIPAGQYASIVFALQSNTAGVNNSAILSIGGGFHLETNSVEGIQFRYHEGGGTIVDNEIHDASADPELDDVSWHIYHLNLDAADNTTGFAKLYHNGVYYPSANAMSSIPGTWKYNTSDDDTRIFADTEASIQDFNGSIGFLYFYPGLIDFSLEENRLKFVDAFNYPIDVTPAIENGDIPQPALYFKFDDPTNLGKNEGYAGDFITVGTITQGSDVDTNA